jgi:predicted dehydrogenase
MASKIYNVGVIGYGYVHSFMFPWFSTKFPRMSAKVFHIPLISTTSVFTLYGIVQRTPKLHDDAAKDHPSAKIYRSADEMFADPSIDIIVITTTPDTHFPFTKAALEAGKHVLVEKPFVPTSSEAQTLIDISAKTGKLICVYQNRRWDTDFLTVQKLLADDKLGRVVEFETHFDRYKPVRPET